MKYPILRMLSAALLFGSQNIPANENKRFYTNIDAKFDERLRPVKIKRKDARRK